MCLRESVARAVDGGSGRGTSAGDRVGPQPALVLLVLPPLDEGFEVPEPEDDPDPLLAESLLEPESLLVPESPFEPESAPDFSVTVPLFPEDPPRESVR